jgi:selenocysteine lyase/cysteine desulfurase
MDDFLRKGGGNPGRSGHRRSIGAARTVVQARERLAELFNVRDSSRIVFTKNATESLNMAIFGLAEESGHVVTTSMEHNSVMRPLSFLRSRGYDITVVKGGKTGLVDPGAVAEAVREDTNLLILTHASNVTGAVNDIGSVGRMCRERGVSFLVDAAQTAGVIPIDVERMCIDFLAFSGHKGLLGPQGTGGLYVGNDRLENPLMRGGTGSLSDREDQPDFLPDRFESGTLNVVGIAGLGAGVEYVTKRGVDAIARHDATILNVFTEALPGDDRFVLFGPCGSVGTGSSSGPSEESTQGGHSFSPSPQTGVLSLNIAGVSPSRVGQVLDREYAVQTRIGLHCAPSAHRTIGTFPDGTVRLSWGPFTTEKDARRVVKALCSIADRYTTEA